MSEPITARKVTPAKAELDLGRKLLAEGCGLKLGPYTLLRRIATGGMAEVFTAQPDRGSHLAGRVALKRILPQHSHSRRFIEMLLDEAKIAVELDHPNIARVHELGVGPHDTYFIVMEYVEGSALSRMFARVLDLGLPSIPLAHAAHVIAEVAEGLNHAHAKTDTHGRSLEIVHRDVSPQNVLISYDGQVKLIDFGIARAQGRAGHTGQGVIKGKLRYLAPEIAGGVTPDHRADIFSAGLMLYELITGEQAYKPRNDMHAIDLARKAKIPPPRARNAAIPEELESIVFKMLKRNRAERYASAGEVARDLRGFIRSYQPGFDPGELGIAMRAMFQAEIAEVLALDRLAERLALSERGTAVETAAHQLETLIHPSFGTEGPQKVPSPARGRKGSEGRLKLVGADGGNPMSILLADPGMSTQRPISPFGSDDQRPSTLAKSAEPLGLSPFDELDPEPPTRRVDSPYGPIGEHEVGPHTAALGLELSPPTRKEGEPGRVTFPGLFGPSDASFSDASLSDASLSGASLSDASLDDTSFPDASLSDASLSDASLSDASLSDASLSDASLSDTSLPDGSLSDGSLSDEVSGVSDVFRASLADPSEREAAKIQASNRLAKPGPAPAPLGPPTARLRPQGPKPPLAGPPAGQQQLWSRSRADETFQGLPELAIPSANTAWSNGLRDRGPTALPRFDRGTTIWLLWIAAGLAAGVLLLTIRYATAGHGSGITGAQTSTEAPPSSEPARAGPVVEPRAQDTRTEREAPAKAVRPEVEPRARPTLEPLSVPVKKEAPNRESTASRSTSTIEPDPPRPVPERPRPAPERPRPAPERLRPAPEPPRPAPERPRPAPEPPRAPARTEAEAEDRERGDGHRSGSVLVNSRPPSIIWVDGKRRGTTPRTLTLKPGDHEFLLKGPDGEEQRLTRTIKKGENPSITHRWP